VGACVKENPPQGSVWEDDSLTVFWAEYPVFRASSDPGVKAQSPWRPPKCWLSGRSGLFVLLPGAEVMVHSLALQRGRAPHEKFFRFPAIGRAFFGGFRLHGEDRGRATKGLLQLRYFLDVGATLGCWKGPWLGLEGRALVVRRLRNTPVRLTLRARRDELRQTLGEPMEPEFRRLHARTSDVERAPGHVSSGPCVDAWSELFVAGSDGRLLYCTSGVERRADFRRWLPGRGRS